MPLFNAVAPPKAGVVLIERVGNLYLHWQDVDGNISENYALTLQVDPDGNGIRGIVQDVATIPQFKKDADGYFYVIRP